MIDSRNILKIPNHRIFKLRRHMGIVFQDFRLAFHKKVYENVAVVLQVLGVPRKEIRRRVFNALRMVNLHNKMWEYPAHLSYGEQQRVAIARAVVNNPVIILADEPTGNLDTQSGNEIMELLLKLNKERNTTLIIVTHDPDVAERTQRVVHIRDGIIEAKEEAQG